MGGESRNVFVVLRTRTRGLAPVFPNKLTPTPIFIKHLQLSVHQGLRRSAVRPGRTRRRKLVPETDSLEGTARPVFQGDWAKADGHARQAHMTLIAKWKSANSEASSAAATRNERHAGSADLSKAQAQGDADADTSASLEALRAIRDDKKALRSDRIRASEALLRSAGAQASSGGDEVALWLAMRTTLEALPPADALSVLLGALEEVGEEVPGPTASSVTG
jgi:hypothetical protein